MKLLLVCAALQLLLAFIFPSAAGAFDLLTAALVVNVILKPAWWLLWAVGAAFMLLPFAVRHEALVLLGPAVLAGFLSWLAGRWNLLSREAVTTAAGFSSLLLGCTASAADSAWTFAAALLFLLRALIAAFAAWIICRRQFLPE